MSASATPLCEGIGLNAYHLIHQDAPQESATRFISAAEMNRMLQQRIGSLKSCLHNVPHMNLCLYCFNHDCEMLPVLLQRVRATGQLLQVVEPSEPELDSQSWITDDQSSNGSFSETDSSSTVSTCSKDSLAEELSQRQQMMNLLASLSEATGMLLHWSQTPEPEKKSGKSARYALRPRKEPKRTCPYLLRERAAKE